MYRWRQTKRAEKQKERGRSTKIERYKGESETYKDGDIDKDAEMD